MYLLSTVTSDDDRESRYIEVLKFDNNTEFDSYVDNTFNSFLTPSYNCIIVTSDYNIILLKRSCSFILDIMYKESKVGKNIIKYIKYISHKELLMIENVMINIDTCTDEEDIKKMLLHNCRDELLMKKIYTVGKYIYLNFKDHFYDLVGSIDKYMRRKITINNCTESIDIVVNKEKDLYMLPGGRKSKHDNNYEDTINRETYEELGKNINFKLYVDKNYIINSKICDKLTNKIYYDLTFICKIDKSYINIIDKFRKNKEVLEILSTTNENHMQDIAVSYLFSILRNIN